MVAGSLFWVVAGDTMPSRALALVGLALFGAVVLQAIHGLRRARS
jgi:hypothetical protein